MTVRVPSPVFEAGDPRGHIMGGFSAPLRAALTHLGQLSRRLLFSNLH